MTVDAQWRADITRQMEASSKAQQDTALALERILGRLNAVERWQTDEEVEKRRREERRDERYEQAPANARSAIGTYGGCIGQAIFACLSTISIILVLVEYLAQHWK